VTGCYVVLFLIKTPLFQAWTWKSWVILCSEKRFGHCKLTASYRTLLKEISFPMYHRVRSAMPSSPALGCCWGPGQAGAAPALVMNCPALALSIARGLGCSQT